MPLLIPVAVLALAALAYSAKAGTPRVDVVNKAPGGFAILVNGREFKGTQVGQTTGTPDGRIWRWNGMTWDQVPK